jgi:hypothetical protein
MASALQQARLNVITLACGSPTRLSKSITVQISEKQEF